MNINVNSLNQYQVNGNDQERNTLFQGKVRGQEQQEKGSKNSKTIYAGNLNLVSDPIEERKNMAQKKAMKIVSDTFDSESDIDNTVDEMKSNVEDLKVKSKEASDAMQDVLQKKEEMKDIADPEEYKAMAAEYDKIAAEYKKEINSYRSDIRNEHAGIEGIKLARLKSHPMVDAEKESDKILETASKEAANMYLDEAKDHIDEKLEENAEKTEDMQEEKKETEEAEAEKEAKQAEAEGKTEQQTDTQPDNAEEIQSSDTKQQVVQKQIKNIMDEQKLLEEDMKGIVVDTAQ